MLKNLFNPITVKNLTIPNRAAIGAMVTDYCNEDGTVTERYLAYHEERAKGGWGLIITENHAVNPTGKGFQYIPGLWDDGQIDGHSELVKRVHKHGSAIFAQIYHCGRQTSIRVIGRQPFAPSPLPCPTMQEVPQELSVEDIKKLVREFGAAARRAQKAGFDGVEVHGAHGYLLAEFMSAYSNKRTDEYGGPLTNRMRFILEIIAEIRKTTGPEYPICFRISGNEYVPGGRTIEDTKAIAIMLETAGVDILHISAGVYGSVDAVIPPQAVPHGWIVDDAAAVKAVVKIPVITVGRINDPLLADAILQSGKADMVAMAREALTDPYAPKKAREGRFEDIRHCIACNQGCIGVLFGDQPIRCVLNPMLGREYEFAGKTTAAKKNVTVVGGGPGGMQAAIDAAQTGHSVTLYEKSAVLGGQARLAAIPPSKGEIAAFVNWQIRQLEQLGVKVLLKTEATPELLGRDRPDTVIIATGGVPLLPDIPGVHNENVALANDVLLGKVCVGPRVTVIGGGQVGAETANHLSIHGKKVTLIEMEEEIAAEEAIAPRIHLLRALRNQDVTIYTNTKALEITETGVRTEGKVSEIAADNVVLALGIRSVNTLAEEAKKKGLDVIVIGDAKEPRQIMEATTEGFEAAMSLL